MKLLPRMSWILMLGLLFSSFAYAAPTTPAPMTEQQKIDALIHSVEILSGAQFIRNGSAYDGKAAADHLQQKRHYAGDRIKTAIDFIACCASKSSMSGQAYQIRFANGKTVNAEVYFRDELKRIEAPPPAAMTAPVPAPNLAPVPPIMIAVPTPAPASPAKARSAASHRHSQHRHAATTTAQKRPS